MRDSIESLARDLAADARMSRLGDFITWRRIIERAVDGCEKRRAGLLGLDEPFASRARAIVAGHHSADRQAETSAAVVSSTALISMSDGEQCQPPMQAV